MPTLGAMVHAIHRRSLRHPSLLADHASTGAVGRLSAVEALGRAHALALALDAEGLVHGDRVAAWCRPRSESLIVDLACQLLGAVWVPIADDAPDATVRYALRNSQARWLFFDGGAQQERLERLASMLDEWATPPRAIALDGDDALPWTAGSLTRLIAAGAPLRGARSLARLRETARADQPSCLLYRPRDDDGFEASVFEHGSSCDWIHRLHGQLRLQPTDRTLAWRPLDDPRQRLLLWATLAAGGAVDFAAPPLELALTRVGATTVVLGGADLGHLVTAIRRTLRELPTRAADRAHRALAVGERFVRAGADGAPSLRLRVEHGLADRLVLRRIRDRHGGALRRIAVTEEATRADAADAAFVRALGFRLVRLDQPPSSGVKTSDPSSDSRALG